MAIRPRFSLLTMILATALLCLSISHWRTSKRLSDFAHEFDFLRVDDPEMAYVVQVPSHEFEQSYWRCHVYLPPGRKYALRAETEHRWIAPFEEPSQFAAGRSLNTVGRSPSEAMFPVDISLEFFDGDRRPDSWYLRVETPGLARRFPISKTDAELLQQQSGKYLTPFMRRRIASDQQVPILSLPFNRPFLNVFFEPEAEEGGAVRTHLSTLVDP